MRCIGSVAFVLAAPWQTVVAASEAAAACAVTDAAGSCVSPTQDLVQGLHASVGKDHALIQFGRGRVVSAGRENSSEEVACCSACAGKFCSPVSGNCYESRAKSYYKSCPEAEPADPATPGDASCCESCEAGRQGFCSPISGNCYESHRKRYYKVCPNGGIKPQRRRLEEATSGEGAIRFMSYNLFGWNAFKQNRWKSENILGKIKEWSPAVLGAQEVEKGGGHGGAEVAKQLTDTTGLVNSDGIGQFYNASILVAHETKFIALVRGYWMSMTRFTHTPSNVTFLFFNSHWKHGYASEQKHIIADAIHAERQRFGSPPTILVGDTNQFCQAREKEAIRYLTGESGSSPVTFVDAIAQDTGASYDGGCRVDFLLASAGQWRRVRSFIDREGMGQSGTASDHAALMAELVPVPGVTE